MREIFNNLENLHPELDLERTIIKKIEKQSVVKQQIVRNKKYGFRGIAITLVLAMLFIWFSSDSDLTMGYKNSLTQLIICTFILLFFFLQFEAASHFLNGKHKKEKQGFL